ncbi:hypothetical protein EXIGLDRAFT_730831, partial [Exidia glandulosa HHB12029]
PDVGIDGGLAMSSTVRTRRRNGGSGAPNAYDARSPCDHRTRKNMNSISTCSESTEG